MHRIIVEGNEKRQIQGASVENNPGIYSRYVANYFLSILFDRRLLKYLMTTEVGIREGETERAAEWDQRVDQEGKVLLDSR